MHIERDLDSRHIFPRCKPSWLTSGMDIRYSRPVTNVGSILPQTTRTVLLLVDRTLEAPSKVQRSSPFLISFHRPPVHRRTWGTCLEVALRHCHVSCRFDFLHTEPQCGGSQKGRTKGPRYDVWFVDFNGLIGSMSAFS
ncbi:hypothetical protein KP79_PYT07074 [Mizuhopecten yessoensis]|uniref:Uncharacterized protein n=1 Tax=Mizuhopecten yessoensis TaxID=6573 RepID=A0A210Q9Y9_MIZYE|nr:hypothetical protein KP79_PYT07074 [Mizuhopecten yessoensis]